jgi:hypothetical protein
MPFKSKKQKNYFYWKAKNSSKWKKMADEFSSHTDIKNLKENKKD